jgi:t-SNARE complex subunit (syntaxin)
MVQSISVPKELKTADDNMRKQAKMSLVLDLSAFLRSFRNEQAQYLNRVKAFKERKKQLQVFTPNNDESSNNERIQELEQQRYKPGVSEEQIDVLIQMEKDAQERDSEIKTILHGIVELQELFKEFSELVNMQQEMIDRIDANVCKTTETIKSANNDLKKAEEYQKKASIWRWFW